MKLLLKRIKLSQNQFAKVPDEHFKELNQHKWSASWSPTAKTFSETTQFCPKISPGFQLMSKRKTPQEATKSRFGVAKDYDHLPKLTVTQKQLDAAYPANCVFPA